MVVYEATSKRFIDDVDSNQILSQIEKALKKKMDKNEAKYPIEKAKGNAKKYTELED